jgi:putative hemolysin
MLIELSLLLAMANPASAACTRAGGTLTFVQSDKGEQGMCTLPSGVVCDEWEFFRGECPAMKKPEDSNEAPKGKKSSS